METHLGIPCLARSEAAQSCSSFGDVPDQIQAAEGHAFWFRPSVLLAFIETAGAETAEWLIVWGGTYVSVPKCPL